MLTFEQKLAIIESFPELSRKDVSLGRINFQYEDSLYDRKNVVYHLHRNGNGFVYAGMLPGYDTDEKGLVNIRDFSEEELRTLLSASIRSLSENPGEDKEDSEAMEGQPLKEQWKGADNQVLTVVYEDDLWYIYSGLSLEMACETYEEAVQYMEEEGFTKQ